MVKIYLESKDESLEEITIDEFIRKSKSFAGGKISKNEAAKVLKANFEKIYNSLKDKEVHTLILESQPTENAHNYKDDYAVIDLFQQFIIYYADSLNTVLCNKVLNPKYVRATGNPATTDINLYGVKKGNDSVSIKSFVFATVPSTHELYVSTTCGSGGTYILFEKLKKQISDKSFYEKEYNKIEYIHLDSIENAKTIGFYSKLGFYKTNKETNKILKNMIHSIYKKDLIYETYIRQASLNIGGSMYWTDNIKIKKKLKIEYEYEPELWFKNIRKLKQDGLSQADVLNHFYSRYHELKGSGIPKDGYDLHAVVIKKPISLEDAFEQSKDFIDEKKDFFRETSNSFRFRNIPKQKFERDSFRSKKINPTTTLIYGKVK